MFLKVEFADKKVADFDRIMKMNGWRSVLLYNIYIFAILGNKSFCGC